MPGTLQTGLTLFHRVGLLALSVLFVLLVLELVRRGLLKERYALLWLTVSLFGVFVGVFPKTIVWLSGLLHVQFLTVLFVMSFLFLLGLVLAFSITISRQTERNRELAQELALLAHEVKKTENRQ